MDVSHKRKMAAFNTAIQDVRKNMKQQVTSSSKTQRLGIDLQSFA